MGLVRVKAAVQSPDYEVLDSITHITKSGVGGGLAFCLVAKGEKMGSLNKKCIKEKEEKPKRLSLTLSYQKGVVH